MATPCKIYAEEKDVRSRLAELGLKIEPFRDVLRHIGLTINSHTEDHPSWGPGITTASEAVFALRSTLKPDGWNKEEEKGFALTVHPTNAIAINIAKGDDGTGDASSEVITVSDKGICTEAAIAKNQMSFDFPEPPHEEQAGRPTWYLLYCKKADGIHAEFSLPVGLSDTKHISKWRERIILPITKEDTEPTLAAGFDDGGFEVKLSRKR